MHFSLRFFDTLIRIFVYNLEIKKNIYLKRDGVENFFLLKSNKEWWSCKWFVQFVLLFLKYCAKNKNQKKKKLVWVYTGKESEWELGMGDN